MIMELKTLFCKDIETERLFLRKFTPDDAEAMFNNWAGDGEVTRYMLWQTHASIDVSREIIAKWCEEYNHGYINWAIVLKESGAPIGSIGVHNIRENIRACELGYCIGRSFWGNGYVPEAAMHVLKYLFDSGFNRVEAYHDIRNPKSGRVMSKIGMRQEGILRDHMITGAGEISDAVIYSVLAADYYKK